MTKDDLRNELIAQGVLKKPELVEAFNIVDRADFVLQELKDVAYQNFPLPIGYNQSISQPFTVFFMLDLLDVKRGDYILEIGTGSGWQTALLCHLVGKEGKVISLERIPELVEFAKENLSLYTQYHNTFTVMHGDGSVGVPEYSPFDKVIAAATAEEIPEPWKDQLKPGGKIVMPVNSNLILADKISDTDFNLTIYEGFAFVPLVNG